MSNTDQPIPTPAAQRQVDFRRRTLPIVIWSAAALACVLMLWARVSQFEHLGVAQALDYEISASADGRLQSVIVSLFDDVEAGDVVARLDDQPLQASLDTARAAVDQLRAQLEAARVQALGDQAALVGELRRFQFDEESRRLEALSLGVVIESDQVELERLDLDVRRALPSLLSGLISEQEYESMRLSRDMVRTRIEENQRLLEQTQTELKTAETRRKRYEEQLPDLPGEPFLEPLRKAIDVETRRLHEIEVQSDALVLRSPVTGQISQLWCRAGQSVVPGEPIVTVTEVFPREIVAWLAESDRAPVPPQRVVVASHSRPDRVAESVVLRTGPSIQALPQRLWRNPQVPDFGRAVVIAGVPGLELTPGELVTVRFED